MYSEFVEKLTQVLIIRHRFLWASLYLDLFCGADTESDLQEELDKLEKSSRTADDRHSDPAKVMKDAYDVFFARVLGQAKTKRAERALRAFQWLTALGGSCEKPVLLAAVNQPSGGDKIVAADCDEALLLVCCQNLVVASDSVFRFCHLSAQEYWREYGKGVEDSHFVVAKTCARVVFNYDNPDVFATVRYRLRTKGIFNDPGPRLDELWDFACMHWRHQLDLVGEEERKREVRDLVLRALGRGQLTSRVSVAINNWVLRLAAAALENHVYHPCLSVLYAFLASEKAWTPTKEKFRVPIMHFSQIGHRAAVAAILGGLLLRFLHLYRKYLEDDCQWPRDLADSYREFIEDLDYKSNNNDKGGERDHDKTTTHCENNAQSQHNLSSGGRLDFNPQHHWSNGMTTCFYMLQAAWPYVQNRKLERCAPRLFGSWWVGDEKSDSDRNDLLLATEEFSVMVERVLEPQSPHLLYRCYEEFARLTVLLVFSRDRLAIPDDWLSQQLLDRYPESYTFVAFEELLPIRVPGYGDAIERAASDRDSRILRCLLFESGSRNQLTPVISPSGTGAAQDNSPHDNIASDSCSSTGPLHQVLGTALISATSSQLLENVRLLIKNGANPNFGANSGSYSTPLIAACATGQLEAIHILIENGADVRKAASGCKFATPLLAAVETCRPVVVKLLLSKLKLRKADRENIVTALEAAARLAHPRIIYLLLSALEACNDEGRSYDGCKEEAVHRTRIDQILGNVQILGTGVDEDSELLEQFAVNLIRIRQASLRPDSDVGRRFINSLRLVRGNGQDPIMNGRSMALAIGFSTVNHFMYSGFGTLVEYTAADPAYSDPSGNAPHTMTWKHAAECWRHYIEGLEERDIDAIHFEEYDLDNNFDGYDFDNAVALKDWLRSGGLDVFRMLVEMRRSSTFGSNEQLDFFQDDTDDLDFDDGDGDYDSGFSVDSEDM